MKKKQLVKAYVRVCTLAALTAPLWCFPALWYVLYKLSANNYFFKQAIASDQRINTWLDGCPDETLSSRCWRARLDGTAWGIVAVALIDTLLGRGHCKNALEFMRH